MKPTRRGFVKMGLAALPLSVVLNGGDPPASAKISSNLQDVSPEALAPAAVNALENPPGPSFLADYVFKGSTLSGWHVFGQADWKAENGEIIGTTHAGSNGGWLVLDKSYQDVLFYGSFRAPAGSKTGVLVRAAKTSDGGMTGIFVSLDPQDQNSYQLTLGSDGKEVSRSELGPVGRGQARVALPPEPAGDGARGAAGGAQAAARGGTGAQAAVQMPTAATSVYPTSDTSFHTDDWNTIEVQMDANVLRPRFNGGAAFRPGATDNDGSGSGYGAIALYVGGTGEVRFKDVCYKDFGRLETPLEKVSANYRMQRIDDFYFSWGASVADVNRDGILDIVTGPYYYLGPDYTVKREIMIGRTFAPGSQFSEDMVIHAEDFTGDGWPDLLVATSGRPLTLYKNPQGELRRWDKYIVGPRVSSEIAVPADIDGDGKKEMLFISSSGAGQGNVVVYAKPDPANPTGQWMVHKISEPGPWGPHGLGAGDITGNGLPDVLSAYGWWEHPGKGNTQEPWTYHPFAFSEAPPTGAAIGIGGAAMAVYDVNGDGLNDVVTSLHAHGFGLAWFEQKRDSNRNISFVPHMIMDDFAAKNPGGVTFTELHGATFADMDGDGIPDFITGKRFISEDSVVDADPWGAPVLYVYHTVRDKSAPGGARFAPELIHNRSGVGSMVTVADLNGKGAMDIITSTNRGTFIFWGKPRSTRGQGAKTSS
jgi:Domain of Unknown Function (DUF1080)/FG-GAP-like repeat